MAHTSVLDRPARAVVPAPVALRQILTDPALLRIAVLAAAVAALLVAVAVVL